MTARSSGGTIGYLCTIAWIWHSWHVPWTSVGRDRTKVALDSHGSRKFTSGDTSRRGTLKEVIGKWNCPRDNKNVSESVEAPREEVVLTPELLHLDAANDSHSALAIYRVLIQQALNLTPRAEPEWFTFNAVGGVLRDDQGRPWFPFNPHYDPGPQLTPAD